MGAVQLISEICGRDWANLCRNV